MKKMILFLLTAIFNTSLWSQPLPIKVKHTVIIDTDAAIEDMRAISILLARPEINIQAILLSDGTFPPEEAAGKIGALLQEFQRKNIPVTFGAKGILAVDSLAENFTLICLGPLSNTGELIRKDAGLLSKIDRVIWYNESVNPFRGFNYECDKEAADRVINSGVRMDVISNLNKEGAMFDSSVYAFCMQSGTQLAKTLCRIHGQKAVFEKLEQNHFRPSDELAALYLTNPELFSINTLTDNVHVRVTTDYSVQGVNEAISDMISGIYVSERNVVFNRFPVQREMFNYDVRPMMDSAISRYGSEEWKANVMTDEFHGHLGVFSIVGAKMGIRAREVFGVGPDMLEVLTYAGSKPPYSCMNDGLQVSTGATLGMGTIHLASDGMPQPMAVFTYKGRSIRIRLKDEYLAKVDADINEGIVKFGLMDDGYWKLIRRNALKYWVEWDRNTIFDVEETANPPTVE